MRIALCRHNVSDEKANVVELKPCAYSSSDHLAPLRRGSGLKGDHDQAGAMYAMIGTFMYAMIGAIMKQSCALA